MKASAKRAAAEPALEPGQYRIADRIVGLPVWVRDASVMFASFIVRTRAAKAVIGNPRVELAEVFPGRAMASIAAIEYRENDLGQYNELAIAFVVRMGGGRALPFIGMTVDSIRGNIGTYIHRLPVTTEFSCEAGRTIWGLPKTVEKISIREENGLHIATLTSGDDHVLTLKVKGGGKRTFQDAPLVALATLDGVLRKTPFSAIGSGLGFRLGGAELTLGQHPIADELRFLGLPKRAMMSGGVTKMSARYDAAIEL